MAVMLGLVKIPILLLGIGIFSLLGTTLATALQMAGAPYRLPQEVMPIRVGNHTIEFITMVTPSWR